MSATAESDSSKPAARAVSRCNGAMIFAFGGAIWLVLSARQFSALSISITIAIVLAAALIITAAFRIQKRGVTAGENAYTEQEKRQTVRTYVIVNVITWTSVLVAVNILANIGYKDLRLPAVVAIVGAHMFFMPPAYRHRVSTAAGACMILWALLASILFRDQTIAGAATLGAGLILWTSAVYSLKGATDSLRAHGL